MPNHDHCESVTGRSSADVMELRFIYGTHTDGDCTSAIVAGWAVSEEDDCSVSESLSLFLWEDMKCSPHPPIPLTPRPPRGTSFLPCLHAEIRSQRRSDLVFLGKGCAQTLTQNRGSQPFPPTITTLSLFPPRSVSPPPALVFIHLQGNEALICFPAPPCHVFTLPGFNRSDL